MKYILVIAAVLAGDPANTDPRLEAIPMLFDTLPECEQMKRESTGQGQGEIEGKKVLRLVGQCQELTPKGLQQLRDTLNR
jgi:hypothetical protein